MQTTAITLGMNCGFGYIGETSLSREFKRSENTAIQVGLRELTLNVKEEDLISEKLENKGIGQKSQRILSVS